MLKIAQKLSRLFLPTARFLALSLFVVLSARIAAAQAYVADGAANAVRVFDTTTHALLATIPVGSGPVPVAITPDGSRAYVGNTQSASVSVIDTANNTVIATVSITYGYPYGIAITPDGAFAYVTDYGHEVYVISTATNTIVATVTTGGSAYKVVISPDGAFAYVSVDDAVDVIDTATNTVTTSIPLKPTRSIWR